MFVLLAWLLNAAVWGFSLEFTLQLVYISHIFLEIIAVIYLLIS